MRVSRLSASGDWTFGRGRAGYATNSDAIRQKVSTRIKSFKNTWFLDMRHGSDWRTILGSKNNESTIISEIKSIVLGTYGVKSVQKVRLTGSKNRTASINLVYVDVFGNETNEALSV